ENENFLGGSTRGRWRAELRRHRARRSSPLHAWHFDQAKKPADPVFQMNDELSFIEFAEVNLRTIASLCPAKLPAAVNREAPQQLVSGKNDKISRRKTKSAA